MKATGQLAAAAVLGCAIASAGCGGQYILALPDQLGPTGGEAPAVVRVQRSEVYLLALAVKDAPMRFRVDGGGERAAYTDKLGYAATTVPVPAQPGRYSLSVDLQDLEGDEVACQARLYAWPADARVVAVDLGCLPGGDHPDLPAARAALLRLAREAKVIYMTRRPVREHPAAHAELAAAGLPDGPILLWQRNRWHVVRSGRLRLPQVVVEARLVSQLSAVREGFDGLRDGVCRSALAARAFAEAGIRPVIVGEAETDVPTAVHRASWQELSDQGL